MPLDSALKTNGMNQGIPFHPLLSIFSSFAKSVCLGVLVLLALAGPGCKGTTPTLPALDAIEMEKEFTQYAYFPCYLGTADEYAPSSIFLKIPAVIFDAADPEKTALRQKLEAYTKGYLRILKANDFDAYFSGTAPRELAQCDNGFSDSAMDAARTKFKNERILQEHSLSCSNPSVDGAFRCDELLFLFFANGHKSHGKIGMCSSLLLNNTNLFYPYSLGNYINLNAMIMDTICANENISRETNHWKFNRATETSFSNEISVHYNCFMDNDPQTHPVYICFNGSKDISVPPYSSVIAFWSETRDLANKLGSSTVLNTADCEDFSRRFTNELLKTLLAQSDGKITSREGIASLTRELYTYGKIKYIIDALPYYILAYVDDNYVNYHYVKTTGDGFQVSFSDGTNTVSEILKDETFQKKFLESIG